MAREIPSDSIDKARQEMVRLQQSLGDDHVDTLAAMRVLSNAHIQHKDYAEARDILSQLLDTRKRIYGTLVDYESTAIAYQLGYVLSAMGNLSWARKVQEQVLRVSIDLYGVGSANAALSLRNLDLTLIAQGDQSAFVKTGQLVVAALLDSSKRPSRDVIAPLYTLAALYRCNGYPDIGSKLYKRTIRGCLVNRREPKVLIKSLIFEILFIPVGLWTLRRNPQLVRSYSSMQGKK